ncbi:MAG: aldehyde dehydrogenase [Novosphingobium sp.]
MDQMAPIAHPDKIFVDGEWSAPASNTRIEVLDSATEEPFAYVPEAQVEDVDKCVAAARRAFDSGPWPRMTHAERAVFLERIGREFDKRATDIASIWTREAGFVHSASQPSAMMLSSTFDYYASLAQTFPFEEQRPTSPYSANVGLLVREPVGVVAAIIPWNGAASLIGWKCAPALLAGCTVVLKASPEAPGACYIFAECCEAAGLPPGVVNVITADREVSESLVRHRGVDKVTFTGSTAAGRKIASICGDRIARCTLELGGKSPALICDDYDLSLAAETIATSARMLTGQVCMSLTRLIVTERRHGAFVEALAASFGSTLVGDPFDESTQMGPLASARQRERVEGHIQRAKNDGIQLALGGGRPAGLNRGYYVEPTIFSGVGNDAAIAREEVFGPVLTVIPAKDEQDMLRMANDTAYGLNASVFTEDVDRAYHFARELRSGTVGHNALRTDFALAFGGFKQSGIGREGGIEGLMPFLETKAILIDGLPSHLSRSA